MLKTLFLDLDGTLLDSEPLWRQAPIRLLCSKNLLIPEDILKRQDELDMRAALRVIINNEHLKNALSMSYDACEQWCFDNMTHLYHTSLGLKPAARELIIYAKEQGLRIAIVTATEKVNAQAVCDRFGLSPYIDYIHSTFGQPEKKSSAELFIRLAIQMHSSPGECILLDDALYALLGAKAAGCTAWAIWDSVREKQWDEIRAHADAHFITLLEVKQHIAAMLE